VPVLKSDRLNALSAGTPLRNASPSILCSEVKASIDGRAAFAASKYRPEFRKFRALL
jgi:hypothetical protein